MGTKNSGNSKKTIGSPSVGIVMATRLEAVPFLERFGLQELYRKPIATYSRDRIVLVVSGIGKANAAMGTTYCCSSFQPDWILNLGAAGATEASYRLGDVYHVTRIIEPDRPLLGSAGPHVHLPEVLPGFREATLATQDRPVIDRKDREEISSFAHLVDMEGGAVAQTARRFETRCALFKFVSDTPEDLDTDDIVDYIRDYRTAFCRLVSDSVLPLLHQ